MLTRIGILLAGITAGIFVAGNQAKAQSEARLFQESRVWEGDEDGKAVYHVHGLTVSKRGTVLAFAEARDDHSDEGPHDLVCKVSGDLGKTWSGTIMIEKADGSFWSREGQPGKRECWANPAAVADHRTGRVFIFYVLNEGQYRDRNTQRMTRVFYKATDDDGKTWSDRKEITALFNVKADGSPNTDKKGRTILNEDGFACDFLGRAFHMPGPGHGIQLKNGRLLLQFWHRTAIGRFKADSTYASVPHEQRHYGVSVIYSDDGGATWLPGGYTGQLNSVNESRVVELNNGRLLLNGRIEVARSSQEASLPLKDHPLKRRWFVYSNDQGRSWTGGHIDRVLPSFTNIDCGFIRYTPPSGAQPVLLFSRPLELDERKGMVISVSEDEGKSWVRHKTVYKKNVQYSDLVPLPDGTIGLLYGRSDPSPGERKKGLRVDEVMFARLSYSWLMSDENTSVR